MTRAAAVVLVAIVAFGLGSAHADGEPEMEPGGPAPTGEIDAERSFHAALSRGDIAALEELGAARPITRWTDDAWSEAARIAVRTNDFARARKALEQVIAIGTDAQLVRRARAELARLTVIGGGGGEWNAVAAAHERIVPALHTGGDPRPALEQLEQLLRAHPTYPRAPMLMVAIASGWEREGEAARALRWLREARSTANTPADRLRVHAELVRTLTRTGELGLAADELAVLAQSASPGLVAKLRHDLDRAELRRNVRWTMWIVLALIAGLAMYALRRAAGSWRAALRRLVRPPSEAIFIVPIAVVLIVFAYTGNPLVARAVRTITIAGVVASWISGAILDGYRGRPSLGRVLVHAGVSIVAVGAATYIAVDSGQMINFVIETWLAGHEID